MNHFRCPSFCSSRFSMISAGVMAFGQSKGLNESHGFSVNQISQFQLSCVFFCNVGSYHFVGAYAGATACLRMPTQSQWEPTRAEVEGNLPTRPTRVWFCSGSAYAATVPAVFLTFRIRAMSAKLSVTRHLVH